MKRQILIALIAALALPTSAGATEIVRPDGGDVGWYQQQITRAHVPGPDTTITLIVGSHACPIAPACTYDESPPRVQFDPAVWPKQNWMHEMGHAFDYTTLREGDRNYFRRVIDDPRPWHSAPDPPLEKFAEAYSACAHNQHTRRFDGPYGYNYDPTSDQHRRVCRMIRKAGGWR